jgi:hypothetical protein
MSEPTITTFANDSSEEEEEEEPKMEPATTKQPQEKKASKDEKSPTKRKRAPTKEQAPLQIFWPRRMWDDFVEFANQEGNDQARTALAAFHMVNVTKVEKAIKSKRFKKLKITDCCKFGKKHKGETWAQIYAEDPGYIQWLHEAEPNPEYPRDPHVAAWIECMGKLIIAAAEKKKNKKKAAPRKKKSDSAPRKTKKSKKPIQVPVMADDEAEESDDSEGGDSGGEEL